MDPKVVLERPFVVFFPPMSPKIGRNDPCPCGSGKKYKKCCGLKETHEPLIPPSLLTGTPYDDYLPVFPIVTIYGEKVRRFEKDGPELKKAVSRFERRFRPGKPGGLTDSFFMSWMHFDFRFGESRETIAERFLKDPMTAELLEPGPSIIRELCQSYFSFYEVLESGPKAAAVEELMTGRRFTVVDIPELYEFDPVPGEILFSRLVGPPHRAIFFTTPYIFGPEARTQLERALRIQDEDFLQSPAALLFPPERRFAESQKELVFFWAEYIRQGEKASQEDSTAFPDAPPGGYPHLVNTDGEELVLAEMHFRIKDEPAVRNRLASIKAYDYDENDGSWVWMKPGSRKDPDAPRTVLGRFEIKDNRLIAETNSRERTARLRSELKDQLGGLIAYDKTLWRDQGDMPELSPGEIEARERESEEWNSRPEIQEAIRKHLEHHYFKEWPRMKIPALGGITPIQAAKTEKGRAKLKVLLDDIEGMEEAAASRKPKVDVDRLRRMLGLPPKAN